MRLPQRPSPIIYLYAHVHLNTDPSFFLIHKRCLANPRSLASSLACLVFSAQSTPRESAPLFLSSTSKIASCLAAASPSTTPLPSSPSLGAWSTFAALISSWLLRIGITTTTSPSVWVSHLLFWFPRQCPVIKATYADFIPMLVTQHPGYQEFDIIPITYRGVTVNQTLWPVHCVVCTFSFFTPEWHISAITLFLHFLCYLTLFFSLTFFVLTHIDKFQIRRIWPRSPDRKVRLCRS